MPVLRTELESTGTNTAAFVGPEDLVDALGAAVGRRSGCA